MNQLVNDIEKKHIGTCYKSVVNQYQLSLIITSYTTMKLIIRSTEQKPVSYFTKIRLTKTNK